MNFIHMIFFNDFKETPIFPREMYFKHTNRIGLLKTKYVDDMKLLFSKKKFKVKSFLGSKKYIIREVEITTGNVLSGTAFFKYEEPLPMSLVYLYDRKKLDVIMKYVNIEYLINEINMSLEEGEIFGLDSYIEFDYESEEDEKKDLEEFVMSLNWFVRIYIDRIFTESFKMNVNELFRKSPMIAYKICEMKELGDRGILSKL